MLILLVILAFYRLVLFLKNNTIKKNNILAVFHYRSLHKIPFYQNKHDGRNLPNTDNFIDNLLRRPLF